MRADHTTPKKKRATKNVGSTYKLTGVDPGMHTIHIAEILNAQWSKKELKVEEEVEASAEVMGIADGKLLTFSFYERNSNSSDRLIDEIKAPVSGNKAKVKWKYPEQKMRTFTDTNTFFSPTLFFRVSYNSHSGHSIQIQLFATLTIKIEEEDKTAVANEPVVLQLSNGFVQESQTDSNGIAVFKKVPPTMQRVRFPQSPNAEPAEAKQANLPGSSSIKTAFPQGEKANLFKLVTLYFYCLHKIGEKRRTVMNVTLFEVVPDYEGDNAYKDEVVILSKYARTLSVNGNAMQELPNEFGLHAYSLKCKQEFGGIIPEYWNMKFWKGLATPQVYSVSGLPRPLTVNCYRPDLFTLQIKFPEMRKWSGGTKVNIETQQLIKNRKDKKWIDFLHRESFKTKEGWDPGNWPKPLTNQAPIIFKRNGKDIGVDFLKSVGVILELAKKISMILSAIQQDVPKVGWYFEWENQFLQGTFVVEWGWKEYKDHRAYSYVGFNIDIKLIEMKMEIGIGVSGFSFKMQAFASLSGALSIAIKGCRNSPEGDALVSLPFSTEIVGTVGARFELGYFVEIVGTIETALKLIDGEFKFIDKEGLSLTCTLQWTGFKAKFKASGGVGKKEGVNEIVKNDKVGLKVKDVGSSEMENTLIDPVDLKKWKWPDSSFQYEPPVIPRKDLHVLLEKKLKEGDNIRVKIGESFFMNDYMEISDVAQKIEDSIHLRNDLRMDPKTAEALANNLRAHLQKLIHEHPEKSGLPHMSKERFQTFLSGGELKSILDKNIDPIKDIIVKNTGVKLL